MLGVTFRNGVTRADVASYSSIVGMRPALLATDQDWSGPLYWQSQKAVIKRAGAIPEITWDPSRGGRGVSLRAIADGRYDSYLRRAARAARAWHGPLYIRFAHEMNLPGSSFGPGRRGMGPAAFVAAWRHVVSVFRRARASNVQWIWSPNVYCFGHCPFTAYYPGDSWVDWVGLDGYNYARVHHVRWLSVPQLFGASYALLERLTSKPVIIAETASVEQGGSKARWITQGLLSDVPRLFPRVRAVVWWQRRTRVDGDLRINSSRSAAAAFRAVAHSAPYMP